jgi:hypothetical protein
MVGSGSARPASGRPTVGTTGVELGLAELPPCARRLTHAARSVFPQVTAGATAELPMEP